MRGRAGEAERAREAKAGEAWGGKGADKKNRRLGAGFDSLRLVYSDAVKVRVMTSCCCSLVSELKRTA